MILKHVLSTCLQLLEVNELVLEPLTDDKVSVSSSTGKKKGTSKKQKVREDEDRAPTAEAPATEAQVKTEEKGEEEDTAPNPEAQKKRHKAK